MICKFRRWRLPATVSAPLSSTLLSTLVAAQAAPPPPVPPSRPDPLDAQATVPPLVYHSPLSSYRRQVDDKPLPWREANDTVGRIGGWRSYAREAQEAASMAAPPASSPAPAHHGGLP